MLKPILFFDLLFFVVTCQWADQADHAPLSLASRPILGAEHHT